jgi:hypothetical protein
MITIVTDVYTSYMYTWTRYFTYCGGVVAQWRRRGGSIAEAWWFNDSAPDCCPAVPGSNPASQLIAHLLVGCHLGWYLAAGWPLWGATEEKIVKMDRWCAKKHIKKKKYFTYWYIRKNISDNYYTYLSMYIFSLMRYCFIKVNSFSMAANGHRRGSGLPSPPSVPPPPAVSPPPLPAPPPPRLSPPSSLPVTRRKERKQFFLSEEIVVFI